MEKKLQIFISSTYTDLVEERQAVVEAILNAGHIPAGMELFKAGDQTQKEIIEEWIKESDVYLLILGARYGSIDPTLNISYTEWEYDLAGKLGIPRFSLVLTDDYVNEKVIAGELSIQNVDRTNEQFKSFRREVESHIVVFINHIETIKGAVLGSLNNIMKKRQDLKGWVRYSEIYDEQQYYKLAKENQDLKNQLLDSRIKLREQTKELKQGEDLLNIRVDYQVYEKVLRISEKTQKEYSQYMFKKGEYFEVEISINDILKNILPYLVQYDKQGVFKEDAVKQLEIFILEKAHILEYKIYSKDKSQYKADFTIPEIDRIITQLSLLGFIMFQQIKGNVSIAITDLGKEEIQKIYAYKR